MASARKQQRQEWKDYLESLPYFEDIAIYLEEKKDIENELKRKLSTKISTDGKSGIAIVLLSVKIRPEEDSDVAPVVKYIHAAHVIEDPVINMSAAGTGKPREEVTEQIIGATHGKFNPISGRAPFLMSTFEMLIDDGTGKPSEDSFFECPASLGIELPQCEAPVIARNHNDSNGNFGITISCATLGASIFYTVDGTRPGTAKTLFNAGGDFFAVAGTVIQARAYLAGFLSSTITTFTVQ